MYDRDHIPNEILSESAYVLVSKLLVFIISPDIPQTFQPRCCKLTVEDLLSLFVRADGKAFTNDRVMLSRT